MNQIEYDSFYKFLVSIGIILIALPIILIIFLLKEPYDLMVSKEEIQAITSTAQQIIEQRQYIISRLLQYAPVICISFFIIGLLLIVLGSKKWYEIQKKIDKKQELENKNLELNISKMTDEEKIKKIEADLDELEPETNNQNLMNVSKSESHYKISEYFAVENKVFELVKAKHYSNYIIRNNVRLGNEEFDIIAISQSEKYNDIIYEVKYVKSTMSKSYLHNTIIQLKDKHYNYYKETNRVASVVLVIITKDSAYNKIKTMVNKYQEENYYDNLEITIIDESAEEWIIE